MKLIVFVGLSARKRFVVSAWQSVLNGESNALSDISVGQSKLERKNQR
jgi:hypothetical protein